MAKITLNEYICLSNNPENIQAKIEELYESIRKESMNGNILEDQGKKATELDKDEKSIKKGPIKSYQIQKSQISFDKEDIKSDGNDKFYYFN